MYSIISLERSVAPFEVPGAADIDDAVQELFAAGASHPGWCFLLLEDDRPVGRVGFMAQRTCPPQFLGALPSAELGLFGLWLPWDRGDWPEAGHLLIRESLARLDGEVPPYLDARINVELHPHWQERRALFESLGMRLFQEKHGYFWLDRGDLVAVPDRLAFSTVAEVGADRYRETIRRVGAGTLDRNDRWYRDQAGPDNWASVFMSFLDEIDQDSWLLATDASGDVVGFAAVSAFPVGPGRYDVPPRATFTFVGVVPEHRGNGYVYDLVLAGSAAAQRRGFASILSDVDVLNHPMAAAFRRCGHRGDARPWHVWHYRADVVDIVERSGLR